jgi:iron complex transport system permease protein
VTTAGERPASASWAALKGWPGIALAVGLSLVCLVVSLAFGPASLSPGQLWHDVLAGPGSHSAASIIFWQIRAPRVVLAFLVGGALAVAGVILQDLFLNPLTDPYVTGVSSGAALGATIAIVAGLSGGLWLTGLALIGGLATLLVVWTAARRRGRVDVYVLLLAGVSASYLLTAIITILMIRANDDLGAILYWLLGSFSGRTWTDVETALFAVPFMIVPLFFTKEMNILLQGEKRALELGVDVERTKAVLVVTAAVLTAIGVSVSGIIGFVGLIIPHLVRQMVGPNHRRLLPFSLLMGAALMGIADLISRTLLAPTEIPVGVVTTFIGAPVFVYLLRRGRRT